MKKSSVENLSKLKTFIVVENIEKLTTILKSHISNLILLKVEKISNISLKAMKTLSGEKFHQISDDKLPSVEIRCLLQCRLKLIFQGTGTTWIN